MYSNLDNKIEFLNKINKDKCEELIFFFLSYIINDKYHYS